MSQLFQTGIIVSKGNSTVIPLAANATFTGAIEDVTSYEEIDINVAGSPSNAPGSLYFEFSPDGTNWDVSILVGGQQLSGPSIVPQFLRVVLPYFRVRYINGGTLQTSFRLTVSYHRSSGTRLTRFLDQIIDYTEPVENVRAFIAGQKPDNSFDNLAITSNNALKIDGSAVTQPVSISGTTTIFGTVTSNQGTANSLANAWSTKITDGTNGSVAVKPASTAAIATDPALVVAISPNNPITITDAHPSSSTTTSISASISSVILLSSNSIRLGSTVYNDSSSNMYIKLGSNATTSDFTVKMGPGAYYETPFGFTGIITGIWDSAVGNARVTELQP